VGPSGGPQLVAWGAAYAWVWMLVARSDPSQARLCWGVGLAGPEGMGMFLPGTWWPFPPAHKELAAGGNPFTRPFGSIRVGHLSGYAPRRTARVRLLFEDNRPALELTPIDPGDRFPVKFFIGFFPMPSIDRLPVTKVLALDGRGRTIRECAGQASPVDTCREP